MAVEFNEQQMKVINHIDGPLLCIAGPGSGKTTSIIQRVVNMTEQGINPANILVVTFTKAAADDMKNKYENKPGAKPGVTFGTIHSLCFSVLFFSFLRNFQIGMPARKTCTAAFLSVYEATWSNNTL